MPNSMWKHLVALIVIISVFILGWFGNSLNELLLFKRNLIQEGELWRFLTGCFVHLGLYHTAMNLAGFAFWYGLFAQHYKLSLWLTILLGIALSNGILLYLFSPEIKYYAGLSGSLHGLILFSLVLESKKDKINVLFALALIAKIIYEQFPSYDINYLQEYMQAPVVVDAHLYGSLVGLILGLVFYLPKFKHSQIFLTR